MSRDDSILYSGTTSASRKLAERRKERTAEKDTKRSQLLPAADLVFAEVQKEKDRLGEILLAIIDPSTPDNQVNMHLTAIRLHREWLSQFENRMRTILRLHNTRSANQQKSKSTGGNDE